MKAAYLVLAAVLLACAARPARAACLSAARVDGEIKKDFTLAAPSGALKLDLCDEKSVGYQLLSALLFLKDLPALDLPKSDFNQNLIDQAPYAFFKARVKQIVIDDRATSDDCPDDRLAYVSSSFRANKKIWVCPNFTRYDVVTQTSALVHESRHEEGQQYDHRSCFAGPYVDQFSCDDDYAEGGSYAIGLEYEVKLAQSPKIDANTRALARAAAVSDFLMRFNTLPLDEKSGALLRDSATGALTFFDGKSETATGLTVRADTVISLRGGLPVFFEPSLGTVSAYAYQGGALTAAPHDVLTDGFLSVLSKADQQGLLDVVYGDAFACMLLKSGLECYGPDYKPFRKDITAFAPDRFLYSSYSRVIDPSAVYLLSSDGVLHLLPATASDLSATDAKDWDKTDGPYDMRAIQPLGGGEIGLTRAGQLSLFSYGTRSWAPVPGFEKRVFRDALAPFVWSKRLNEL